MASLAEKEVEVRYDKLANEKLAIAHVPHSLMSWNMVFRHSDICTKMWMQRTGNLNNNMILFQIATTFPSSSHHLRQRVIGSLIESWMRIVLEYIFSVAFCCCYDSALFQSREVLSKPKWPFMHSFRHKASQSGQNRLLTRSQNCTRFWHSVGSDSVL